MDYLPIRTCVVCRQKQTKNNLLRVVEQEEQFILDKEQKINARGFYICPCAECINSISKKRILSRLKKTNVSEESHLKLTKMLNNFINKQ